MGKCRNEDTDVAQAGQAIGAINDVPPAAALVGKTRLLRHLCIKMVILPRQARDKHRENSKKDAFLQVKSMMEELVAALQLMGKIGSQVPSGAKFEIEVPADAPLTLANL